MLGSGLVEYESSDDGEGEVNAAKEEEESGEAGEPKSDKTGVADAAAAAVAISSSDSDEAADSDDDDDGGDALAAMAAANDAVEESLRMRVPASAAAEAANRTSDLHGLPSSSFPHPQQQQQGQVPQKPSSSAATKKQQLLEKRRRILLLGAPGAATAPVTSATAEAGSSDEDDEDAVKRRRVVAAAATDSGRLRGASSLLARLPRPKALAVREGGARVLAAAPAAAVASASARPPPPSAASSLAADEEDAHHYDDDAQQKQALLGAILPQRELLRYRQATGASLTAEVAGGSGGSGGGILDIRQSDQLAGADLQMAKELTRNADATDPRRKPAGPLPGSMAKRKHQITYLAYQAQEREIELKNSWADARFNQRSSQNKYGF